MKEDIITAKDCIGQEKTFVGWVDVRRDHGKLIFIDLRDRSGKVQLVVTPDKKEVYEAADLVRPEWVISVTGLVKERPKDMQNKDLKTGKVEVEITSLKVLSEAKTPPIDVHGDGYDLTEEKRIKYRYLDIRRKRMLENIAMRHEVNLFFRNYLSERGFIEIETPILSKSTPEGARDFLVPSRIEQGSFYALPQSPQQYKQLLMVGGVEKYFQIARCFRDEDSRGDRQPEFTQLDIEMSFVEQEDVLKLVEEIYSAMVKELYKDKKITEYPFPRLKHDDVIEKYKSDTPDLRKDKKNKDELAFAIIHDFPLFERTKTKELVSSHHPFTAPKDEDIELLDSDPMKVRSWQYDLVLNGNEVGGGSIRITDAKLQTKIFEMLGHSKDEIRSKFGHLLDAFNYGVPPHGGIALGIDRLLMVLQGEDTIREVIAFPKTGDGRDPMMGSPSEVDESQLKELGISVKKDGS